MRRFRATAGSALALLLLSPAACATIEAPRGERPAVTLPPPPAVARLRLVAIAPDPDAPRPSLPWWRAALNFLTGAEEGETADPGTLVRPFGVALGPVGELVVADPDAGRVVRYPPRGVPRDLRCSDRAWEAPIAVARARDGAIYVADGGAGVVVRWTPTGCTAIGRGELERPTAIAIAPDRIWVADPPRHRVLAFTPQGTVAARVGERGDGVGRFHFPSALAATPDGGVAVVDALNFRIVRLDASGGWVSSFGSPGTTESGLARPKGIAADETGRLWVTDAQRDAVLVFEPDGTFAFEVGSTGDAPGQFQHPAAIAVEGSRVAVADSQNHRVQTFERIGAAQ